MRIGTPDFQGARLREAREARGLTIGSLGDLIGVTRQAVSRYELGEATPSPATMERIADVLKLPLAFFLRGRPETPTSTFFWRSMRSATKTARLRAERRYVWLSDIVDFLRSYIDFPASDIPDLGAPADPLKLADDDVERLADETRERWGLGRGPIPDVTLLVENHGVIVSRFDLQADELDAFSHWNPVDGHAYVVLGADKDAAARSRLDLAHELGHLVMHRGVPPWAMKNDPVYKVMEAQAFRFAGAFLVPQDSFRQEFRRAKLESYLPLKARWKVSIGALIMRSFHLGLISPEEHAALFRNYTRNGWKKHEPYDDQWKPETPYFIRRAVEMLIAEKILRPEEFVALLDRSASDIENLANLAAGTLGPTLPSLTGRKFKYHQ